MSRINTNVPSMTAQRVLGQQNDLLNTSLNRLSTGLRINRGSDDPAGLIASETLRAEMQAIGAAMDNAERAEQVINVAEGGLQEINSLLLEVQSLVGQSANDAGISEEEKEANQLQVDSILQTIDRIANSTSFNGAKLLNGNFDYTTGNGDTAFTSGVRDVSIKSARLSNDDDTDLAVTVDVTASAQTAGVYLTTSGGFTESYTIEVTGVDGVQQFTFASGASSADVATAVNSFTEALGVSATTSGANVIVNSTGYGDDAFVKVKVLDSASGEDSFVQGIDDDGSLGTASSEVRDVGRDASVQINGNQATVDGLVARVATDGFDVTVTLSALSDLNSDGSTAQFDITGGGADFNLGPRVNLSNKVSLGIETVTTGNLGDAFEGFLSDLKTGGGSNLVDGDLTSGQKIVDAAISQISSLRGRLGALTKNTVGATLNNLAVTMENTAAAESVIRDADFAQETASLTRQQILSQASSQALQLANQQPQQVLSLLG